MSEAPGQHEKLVPTNPQAYARPGPGQLGKAVLFPLLEDDEFAAFEAAQEERAQKARFPARFTERHYTSADEVRTVTRFENGMRFEQPTDEIIEHLKADEPRIDVVHSLDRHSVWDALADKLDEDFADKDVVMMRSMQVSLDGLVSDGHHDTHDIRDIVRVGDFQMRKRLNLAGFVPGHDKRGNHRIHHRVQQYGSETDYYRDVIVGKNVEGVDRIFPAVLVYDHNMLQAGGVHYGWALPESDEDRAKIILKAYVLDTEVRR